MIIDETLTDEDRRRLLETLPASILPDYASIASPPSYAVHARPKNPMIYSFTEWSTDHIVLMPPIEHRPVAGSRPLYHITIKMKINPLAPISYTTSISRGDTEELVGEFHLSLYHKRGSVSFGNDVPRKFSDVLYSVDGSKKHWAWSYNLVQLRWDCRTAIEDGSPMCICYDARSDTQFASFVPAPVDAVPPIPDTILTVWPDGHQILDHILLSALAIERKRLLAV